ncbi:MAG: tetratricopeptide repeat protein, partial [Burkholderiales bacterium]|nr:tetratricopeptide repeat protein [Burkholderiales bacterium]
AEQIYRKALEVDPTHFDSWHMLGVIAIQAGMPAEAAEILSHAISIHRADALSRYNLGIAFRDLGKMEEAISSFRKAIELKPGYVDAHNNLGVILHNTGRMEEAATHYRKAIALQPSNADAHNNLGNILNGQGKFQEALRHLEKAVSIRPDFADAWNNLGNLISSQGKSTRAIECYLKALEIHPSHLLAHNNLGAALIETKEYATALRHLGKAIEISPDYVRAHYNLGVLYQETGEPKMAIDSFRKVLELDPQYHAARSYLLHELQRICDWKEIEELSAEVRRAVREEPASERNRISAFAFLAVPGATPLEQRICAEKWSEIMYGHFHPEHPDFPHEYLKKLHIGYISADFREHPVSQLLAQVIELHDRSKFTVSAYSYGIDDGSEMRKRMENAFDNFVEIGDISIEDAAKRIHSDKVDILVDLTGYTTSSRTGILALRPAPVQMSYLGYPGTMGATFFDYLISDRFLIPEGSEGNYREKIAYLRSYQANDRKCPIEEKPSRSSLGLPEEAFVFCCFNQTYKIIPEIFEIWMKLLSEVPGSVLWLLASNEIAAENLKMEARKRNIAEDRIIFAQRESLDLHLARLQCADLFLDTLPYNAGTTASNALWAGLPVVTCPGETFASRMAGSLLTALEIPELIADSLEEYRNIALKIAVDASFRTEIRNRIRNHRDSMPLFDSVSFTGNLESMFIEKAALSGRTLHANIPI